MAQAILAWQLLLTVARVALQKPASLRVMGQNASASNFSAQAQTKFYEVAGQVNKNFKCFDKPLDHTQQSVGGQAPSQPYVGGPMSQNGLGPPLASAARPNSAASS